MSGMSLKAVCARSETACASPLNWSTAEAGVICGRSATIAVWTRLQDEISRSIVEALTARLQPGMFVAPAPRSTTNPDAYEYYLKGRSFLLRGLRGSSTLTA